MRVDTPIEELLAHVLTAPPEALAMPDVATWWARHREVAEASPVAAAIRGGFIAACPGFAFASGYQAALRALVPTLPDDAIAALCVTEHTGQRDLATVLVEVGDGAFVLRGHKSYVTLGADARVLLVAATRGLGARGRPNMLLVRVDQPRDGVSLTAKAPLPFVPELPHAELTLADARVAPADVLPGDGYRAYVKPFRTVEDVYIQLALGAFVLRVARHYRWPRATVEALVGLIVGAVALAASDPRAPAMHVALAAHLAYMRALLADCEPHWDGVAPDERARWRRDQPLLKIAEPARAARLESAWRELAATPAQPA